MALPNRRYFTTPIYYVNGRPHLGNAYTMVVTDSFARWHRLLGEEVFFLTGTDEHGQKVADAAREHGLEPRAWADSMAVNFVEAWQKLGIRYDDFIRTTEERHYRTVQTFLTKINEAGYLYKSTYSGLYCVSCEAYYTEAELLDGEQCPVHLRPVTHMAEENYFFRLSAFTDRLLEWYEAMPDAVFPQTRRNEALGFIASGLEDISITRTSIDWGVPVPWDREHVFYVWYDALINYLTAIGYGEDDATFEKWWPVVHHVLGKDIIRFHCVWWPAMCMAAGIEPPRRLIVHGWLLAGGEKMSKSRGNNVDPLAVVDEYGLDALRYYLLRDSTFGADGDFTYEGLAQRYNADLANNYGNLAQRVVAITSSKLGGVAPRPPDEPPEIFDFEARVQRAVKGWNEFAPHEALEATWELIRAANAHLEANEPWKSNDGSLIADVLGSCLEVLRVVSHLASPALIESATKVLERIGIDPDQEDREGLFRWGGYPGDGQLMKGEPLFPRLNVHE
jgi:methionyl-tRNA synthetase